MKCPNCGSVLPDKFQTCSICGAYVSPLYQDPELVPRVPMKRQPRERPLVPEEISSSLRTYEPVIGGLILVVLSILAIVVCLTMDVRDFIDSSYLSYDESVYSLVSTILKLTAILSPVGLVGGIAAMFRRNFAFANVACVACVVFGLMLFYLFGLFAALVAWGLIATSNEEFLPTFPDNQGEESGDTPIVGE